jgi:hypothetical protein
MVGGSPGRAFKLRSGPAFLVLGVCSPVFSVVALKATWPRGKAERPLKSARTARAGAFCVASLKSAVRQSWSTTKE